MIRTWLAPAMLLGLLGVTACSGSDPSAAEPTPTGTASPSTSPVSLRSYPGFTSCQIDHGRFLVVEPMRVRRPVTLGTGELVGATNVSAGATTLAPAPAGKHPDGFILHGSTPPSDLVSDLGWKNREPLDGAQLSAGRYYVFVALKTRTPGAHIDGVALTWDEDGRAGSADAQIVTDFKDEC